MNHGKKKVKKEERSQQEVQEEERKAEKIAHHLKEFMDIRTKPKTDPKYLTELTDILIQLCSDITTIYNFRRELIDQQLDTLQNPADRQKLLDANLKLTTKLIKSDPKSYCTWSFRQWLVLKLYRLDPANSTVLQQEHELCKLMLMKDEKNFHVWNYRHWLHSISVDLDKALQFTHEKTRDNPFNFSPYHFRTKHIAEKYKQLLSDSVNPLTPEKRQQVIKYGMKKEEFEQELEKVKTAIVMNSNEEAPWTYYRWLVSRSFPNWILKTQRDHAKVKLISVVRVYNFFQSIQTADKNFKLASTDNSEPSSTWGLILSHPDQQFKVLSNLESSNVVHSANGYLFLGSIPEKAVLTEAKSFLKQELEFIEQVLQSEEYKCRYAFLEILYIKRNMMFLVDGRQEWQSLVGDIQTEVFEKLKDEIKGAKYIQKQREVWENILKRTSNTGLTEAEVCRLEDLWH